LDEAVARGIFPGAVLAVRRGRERVWLIAAGRLSVDPPGAAVTPATIYDLASLTKPLSTATSVSLLLQQGQCRLDDPIESLLPELAGLAVGASTVRQLLSHSSGLPGWRGFYERLSPDAVLPSTEQERSDAVRKVVQLIGQESLVYGRGERSLYSDLGFMLLGAAVERRGGSRLDHHAQRHVIGPTKAEPLCYLSSDQDGLARRSSLSGRIAPTEWDSWRGRLLVGEVHDENAAALGGVAGHAGFFGTAEAVLAVSGAWLAAYHGRPSILDAEVAREFVQRQDNIPGSSWALGWDTPSAPSSSGKYFSSQSFGHLGYAGTSVWIDPVCELEVVLLSNRVHPTRRNEGIKMLRPLIHDLVYQECIAGA
jgi:CubicO group peptidase (beta-lactamase class C family)